MAAAAPTSLKRTLPSEVVDSILIELKRLEKYRTKENPAKISASQMPTGNKMMTPSSIDPVNKVFLSLKEQGLLDDKYAKKSESEQIVKYIKNRFGVTLSSDSTSWKQLYELLKISNRTQKSEEDMSSEDYGVFSAIFGGTRLDETQKKELEREELERVNPPLTMKQMMEIADQQRKMKSQTDFIVNQEERERFEDVIQEAALSAQKIYDEIRDNLQQINNKRVQKITKILLDELDKHKSNLSTAYVEERRQRKKELRQEESEREKLTEAHERILMEQASIQPAAEKPLDSDEEPEKQPRYAGFSGIDAEKLKEDQKRVELQKQKQQEALLKAQEQAKIDAEKERLAQLQRDEDFRAQAQRIREQQEADRLAQEKRQQEEAARIAQAEAAAVRQEPADIPPPVGALGQPVQPPDNPEETTLYKNPLINTLSNKTLQLKEKQQEQVKKHIKPFTDKYDNKLIEFNNKQKYFTDNKAKFNAVLSRIGCLNL